MNSSHNCNCQKNKLRFSSVSHNLICERCCCHPDNCSIQIPGSTPETSGIISTGAIWRNPNTETIVITILNKTNSSQTITISVLDWQNCDQSEMPKEALLCGEVVSSLFNGNSPLTFTIPSKSLLVVRATPQNVWQPGDPCYEVLVTLPSDPITPGDPCIVNTWGINALGTQQEGNTVLHHQFRPIFIT